MSHLLLAVAGDAEADGRRTPSASASLAEEIARAEHSVEAESIEPALHAQHAFFQHPQPLPAAVATRDHRLGAVCGHGWAIAQVSTWSEEMLKLAVGLMRALGCHVE